jgi:hypothetical protein
MIDYQNEAACINQPMVSYPFLPQALPRFVERMALIIPTLPHASAFERLGYDLHDPSDVGKAMESALLLAFAWWVWEGDGRPLDTGMYIEFSASSLWDQEQRHLLENRSRDAEVLFRKTLPINDIPDGRHAAREAITHLIDLVRSVGELGRTAVARAEVALQLGLYQ